MLSKICCYSTDFCKCQFLGLSRNKNVKLGYILILLLGYFLLLISNSFIKILTLAQTDKCNQGTDNEKYTCVKHRNSLIIFLSVAALHLILTCCMFCKTQKLKVINEGLWLLKIVSFLILVLFFWLIQNTSLFNFLDNFSLYGSNILYILEAIVFVDLVYTLDNFFQECSHQNKKIHILKAILSFTMILLATYVCYLSFKYNEFYVCLTNAIAIILFLLLAVLRIFPGNSIFIASIISLCANVLGYYIQKDEVQLESSFSTFLKIFKLLFVLFLLVGMLCQGSNKLRTRKSSLNQLLALNTSKTQEDNRYVSSNKWTVYHYIMSIIALTIPAVICYQDQNIEQNSIESIGNITWWVGVLVLYLWSLICSKLFPQKDFSDLENYFRQYELQ